MIDRRKIGQSTIEIPQYLRAYRYQWQRLYLLHGEKRANEIWRSYYIGGELKHNLVESRDYEPDVLNKQVSTMRL